MVQPTLFVATWHDGVFVVAGENRRHELAGRSVRGLTSDGPGSVLAIVDGRSLCRRGLDGTWSTIADHETDLTCCLAVDDTVYVGTENAHLLRLSGDGQFRNIKGFDAVAGRGTWFAGSAIVNGQVVGPPLEVRSMAFNADEGALFANVHVGGIPRSTDGGATWQPTIDVDHDVHEVRVHPRRAGVVVAAAAVGLCISQDGGATWSVERDGLHAAHCSAVAVSGDTVFVAASEDPFAPRGAVYQYPLDTPSPCRPVGEGLPRWTDGIVDTGCIAANGSTMAIADRSGNVYVRQAARGTWSRCARGLAAPSGLLVV